MKAFGAPSAKNPIPLAIAVAPSTRKEPTNPAMTVSRWRARNQNTSPMPLLVDLDVERTLFALILRGVVGTLAAYMPARRAAKKDIIDALGHV